MGCGGSKDEVATGNTISTKSLQRTKSNGPKTSKNVENTNDVSNAGNPNKSPEILTSPESGGAAAGAGDGTVQTEGGEGKIICKDSPDRYFSTRKDESPITAVAVVGPTGDVVDTCQVENEVVVNDGESTVPAELESGEKEETKTTEDSKVNKAALDEVKDLETVVTEEKNLE